MNVLEITRTHSGSGDKIELYERGTLIYRLDHVPRGVFYGREFKGFLGGSLTVKDYRNPGRVTTRLIQ